MSDFTGIYIARLDATSVSTARTLVQVNAPATRALRMLRMWVSFSTTTSASIEIGIKRVTTAGTGTSFTPIKHQPGSSSAASTATNNHTAEGTIGDIIWREYCNMVSGWVYLPIPEERIIVEPSGRVALYFPSAPAAVNVSAGIVFAEVG